MFSTGETGEAAPVSSSDPQHALDDAIKALREAKKGKSDEDKAKLDRFVLELQDVLGRLAADEAMHSR